LPLAASSPEPVLRGHLLPHSLSDYSHLVKEGYDQATTNRIAEVAGVSIGSLYQYFPSKGALVRAVIDRHDARTFADHAKRPG
jgi:hypothetical protein